MIAADNAWLARRNVKLAHQLARYPMVGLAFTHACSTARRARSSPTAR